jgi:hypothetical protein
MFGGFNFIQYLFITIFFLLPGFLIYKFQSKISTIFSRRIINITFDLLVIFVIIGYISIISPVSLWNGKIVFTFDYKAVMGSVNDILGGKTVLVNTYSQYGFIMPYALSIVFSIIPLEHTTFFYLNYVTTIFGYIIIFLGLRKWFKNPYIPLLWVVLAPFYHYFAPQFNILFFCQQTFFRYGWWAILFLFFTIKDKLFKNENKAFVAELLLVDFSLFWAFDVGTYIFMAYFGYISISYLLKEISWREKLIRIIKHTGYLFISICLFFVAVNIFSYLRAGTFPNWSEYYFHTKLFSSGYGLYRMPVFGSHTFVMIQNFGLIIYIIFSLFEDRYINDRRKKDLPIVGFLTVFSVFNFLYYVGESGTNALAVIMLPNIILFCWIVYQVSRIFKSKYYKNFYRNEKAVFVMGLFALFLTFNLITTVSALHVINWSTYSKPLNYFSNPALFENMNYGYTVQWLKNYIKDVPPYKRKLALITEDDSYFLIFTKSTNVIDSGNNYYFLLKSQYNKLCEQLIERKPKDIFIESGMGWEWTEILRNCAKDRYHFVENIGFLDRYQIN